MRDGRTTAVQVACLLFAHAPHAAANYCFNDCAFDHDGECDDGGPGSVYFNCAYDSDCADCGCRFDCEDNDSGGTDGGGPNYGLLFLLIGYVTFLLADSYEHWVSQRTKSHHGRALQGLVPCRQLLTCDEIVTCRFVLDAGCRLRAWYDGRELTSECTHRSCHPGANYDACGECTPPVYRWWLVGGTVATLRFRRRAGAVLTLWCEVTDANGRPNASESVRRLRCRLFWACLSTHASSPWNFRLTPASCLGRCVTTTIDALDAPPAREHHIPPHPVPGMGVPVWAEDDYDDALWRSPEAVPLQQQWPIQGLVLKINWADLCTIIASVVTNVLHPLLLLVLFPTRNALAWGLAGNGLWAAEAREALFNSSGAAFRFVVDTPAVSTGRVRRGDDHTNPSSMPVPLVAVQEPQVLPTSIAKLATPISLPRELDLYHILHGPRSSDGQRHERVTCVFCSGSGELRGWTVPCLMGRALICLFDLPC